ncbi:uncharacterized protein BDR25DRAFT_380028 [Lindgomyces ingoldianus]|uniref:Uncharacterized protein n=1 Tax=Lindgomyces ingoldianus TaxID=673940 RepID=A0ACB6QDC9_9PLEO|nr:uncharacterized protein BDR25DRAFT_380028 [Lindgomyces ingoldianus]KAF2464989.1 hypothetical protein BDR25DRAFT_380028 [Lindgomyces ingoldianus]
MNSFPEEALDFIISEFSASEDGEREQDAKSLFSLSLVSCKLHRIAKPYSYQKVQVNFQTGSCLRLKQTLERRSALAQYVIGFSTKSPHDQYIGGSEMYPYKIEALHDIMVMLPNLQSFAASQKYAPHVLVNVIKKLRQSDQARPHVFQSFLGLRNIDLDIYSYDLKQITPILQLPLVETLALWNLSLTTPSVTYIDDGEEEKRRSAWRITNTSIKSLSISTSAPNEEDPNFQAFANIFASLKALKMHESEELYGAGMFRYVVKTFEKAFKSSLNELEMMDRGANDVNESEGSFSSQLEHPYLDALNILRNSKPGLPTRRSTVRLGDFEACTGEILCTFVRQGGGERRKIKV